MILRYRAVTNKQGEVDFPVFSSYLWSLHWYSSWIKLCTGHRLYDHQSCTSTGIWAKFARKCGTGDTYSCQYVHTQCTCVHKYSSVKAFAASVWKIAVTMCFSFGTYESYFEMWLSSYCDARITHSVPAELKSKKFHTLLNSSRSWTKQSVSGTNETDKELTKRLQM